MIESYTRLSWWRRLANRHFRALGLILLTASLVTGAISGHVDTADLALWATVAFLSAIGVLIGG